MCLPIVFISRPKRDAICWRFSQTVSSSNRTSICSDNSSGRYTIISFFISKRIYSISMASISFINLSVSDKPTMIFDNAKYRQTLIYGLFCRRLLVHNLLISFCSVMRFAQHFTILNVGRSAFAPSCNVVCVHFGKFPNFGFVGIMTDCTMGTI